MINGQAKKQYKVLRIVELTRVADAGGIERYYRHTIKTAGGTVLNADISEGDFTEEKVKGILGVKATEADKILNL